MNKPLHVFPAHAGMSPADFRKYTFPLSFPRTRGDEPLPAGGTAHTLRFSPHTRG